MVLYFVNHYTTSSKFASKNRGKNFLSSAETFSLQTNFCTELKKYSTVSTNFCKRPPARILHFKTIKWRGGMSISKNNRAYTLHACMRCLTPRQPSRLTESNVKQKCMCGELTELMYTPAELVNLFNRLVHLVRHSHLFNFPLHESSIRWDCVWPTHVFAVVLQVGQEAHLDHITGALIG